MRTEKIASPAELLCLKSEKSDLSNLSEEVASRLLFLIILINAFERSLIELKAGDGVWGPIHLSLGQEAIAAAMATSLRRTDQITGSHRAHHITLAKIIEAVRPDGWVPGSGGVPAPIADAVYRTLAEIMGLAPGWCGGRGGSMHLRHAAAGVLGTNAIVAGGVPLSVGAALAAKRLDTGSVVVAFLGDGAVNQGSFHESCNLAALWRLPIVFAVENNQYAVATSIREACAAEELVQFAGAYGMQGCQVLGHDVPALCHAFRESAETARSGEGPVLLEVKCYRHFHHGGDQPGSRYGYRTTEEETEWMEKDAFRQLPRMLVKARVLTDEKVAAIRRDAESAVSDAVSLCAIESGATAGGLTPRPELLPDPGTVTEGVRSTGTELSSLPYRTRDGAGKVVDMTYADSIAAVAGRWMELDESVIVMGEEVANFGGGAYGATKKLPELYPDRIINTPISEAGFSGAGLGAAMCGMKPIVELMFPDFALVAADQVFNQIGKARHMYGGTTDLPLVLRTRIAAGCGYGGQHSMDPVGLYAAFSGWRIVAPANAFDYIGLFNTAMHSLDPVVILEHHSLYTQKFPVPAGDLDYCVPFGAARVVREGGEITVAAYGAMVPRAVAVAESLANEGISAEVIDLRTLDLANLDFETLGQSLGKTGVIAIVEQAAEGHAIGRRIAATVTERFFNQLDAPPGVITSQDVPNSVSRVLEEAALISDGEITNLLRLMARREWK
jgi:2-oxoisovalerate dehydrogenase E1 component